MNAALFGILSGAGYYKAAKLEGGLAHTTTASRRRHPSLAERLLVAEENHGRGPLKAEEQRIYEALLAAYPEALSTTKIYSGEYMPAEAYRRIWHNPRLGPVSKAYNMARRWPQIWQDSSQYRAMGPFYDPAADTVFAPWRAPAATMHELGHAADFNSILGAKIPKNWVVRQVKNTGRDLYGLSYRAMPLWHEHAAWRKGRNGLLRGSAKLDRDFEKEVAPIIRHEARSKRPALGSYWGGTLGLAGATALALTRPEWYRELPLLGRLAIATALPTLGGLAGLGIGAKLRHNEEKHVERFARKYDEHLARERRDKKPEEEPEEEDDEPLRKAAGLLLGNANYLSV